MFGLFKKKPVGSVRSLAEATKDNDALLFEHINKGYGYANISFLALVLSFEEVDRWAKNKDLRSVAKNTNTDILAGELALFVISQAIYDLENDPEYEDEDDFCDVDEIPEYEDLVDSLKLVGGFYDREYGDTDDWYNDRVKNYSKDPKHACECLAFNLTAVNGAQGFDGLARKVGLDPFTQVHFIAVAISFRLTMIPAFLDAVDRLAEIDEADFRE